MSAEAVMELANVSRTYGQGEATVFALRNVSLRVLSGEVV